jgi:hypothetical protein
VAATSRVGTLLRRWRGVVLLAGTRHRFQRPYLLAADLLGLLAGVFASGSARAVELPEDAANLMYHYYDGAGTKAYGPALLVRKSLADKVSLFGGYYLDQVSNASIDVVTTASKYKETRHEEWLGFDYVYRDATLTLSGSNSDEPDYKSKAFNIDVQQETFGNTTTVAFGYTRAWDKVGENVKGQGINFFDTAKHWRYRLGLSQILTPRLIASANFEAVSDDGFLGSPYRAARAFGALVKENDPRTRTSRAIRTALNADMGSRDVLYGAYRYLWDTWAIHAHTVDFGYRRYFGDKWLGDAYLRYYRQGHALFYSDNSFGDSLYLSRNRTLSTFKEYGLGTKVAYSAKQVPGKYEIKINGVLERARFSFSDFTDIRTGSLFKYNQTVAQLSVALTY